MASEITMNLDLHTRTQISRPPMIQKGCQSFCPMVYKRLNVQCIGQDKSKCGKVKNAKSKGGCYQWWKYGPGTNGFTSDVSPLTNYNWAIDRIMSALQC